MEQERRLGPEPSDADTPFPRRRRGATANTQEASTEGVRPGRPCLDVRASMARDVQCKHVSNLHVILHNRHQQLGSHCIMLSVGAEKALPGARGLHDAPCSPG
jgi:hypothetical protein